jgi:MoxR-like ATPase
LDFFLRSELGRRLSQLCGGLFFQRLLTRFTTPEEIFGPLSLRALENDEYKRCTQGFLPVASVAFLDEIFKANSAILNTLLTVLNERQFDNGAGVREECPIRCVVGASNEMPESDELDALYDRFLLRKEVLPVSDAGLMQILRMSTPGASSCDGSLDGDSSHADNVVLFTDGLDNVINSLSVAVESVQMGDDACTLMRDLRSYMRDELDVDVSDRRLVKAARLLKFSAASHGRTRVDPIDCLLLQHMAWRLPEQRNAIRDWLWDHLTPGGAPPEAMSQSVAAQSRLLIDGLRREAMAIVQKTTGDVTGASGGRAADIEVIRRLRVEVSRIASLLQQRADLLGRHMELLKRSKDHLWLDPDEARAALTLLLPKAQKTLRDVIRALSDAHALELALGVDSDASPEDNTLRLSVVELLRDDDDFESEVSFTDIELTIGMREAKAKYDLDTFRAWKRAKKKAGIK